MFRGMTIIALLLGVVPSAFGQTVSNQPGQVPSNISTGADNPEYLVLRTKFLDRVSEIYFAVGCKVLPGGEFGILPLVNNEGLPLENKSIADHIEDPKLHVMISNAAFDSLTRATRGTECSYWNQHQDELSSIKEKAEAAWDADDSASRQ